MTREQWLNDATVELSALLSEHGGELPEHVRVSCSWPSQSIRKRIGEAWSAECSTDRAHETFISPILSDSVRVLDVLTHELVHHCVGVEHGHKAPFARLAKAVGLTGKMTATVAGPELTERLNAIAEKLGPYPHATLSPTDGRKKQGTRMIKCECPDCGYVARTTGKWLSAYGAPLCPCNSEPMHVECESDDE